MRASIIQCGDKTIIQNEDTTEFLSHLTEVFDELKEFFLPLPRRFSHYQLELLVRIFGQLQGLEYSTKPESIGLGVITIRQRWKELMALEINHVEHCLELKPKILAQGMFESLMRASLMETEEKSQIDRIAELIQSNYEEQSITHEVLVFYHQLYEGRYKLLLAFYHFMINLQANSNFELRKLDKLRSRQVFDNLKYLKRVLPQAEYNHICLGADPHLRNAIAHREVELREGKVKVRDGRWTKAFDFTRAELLVKSLNLTMLGLLGGLLVSSMKHNDVLRSHVQYKYHIEDIQQSLSSIVTEYKFVLTRCVVSDNDHLYCSLREMDPSPFDGPNKFKHGKTTLQVHVVNAKPRRERIQDLISGCELMFQGYKKVTFESSDNKGEQIETVEHVPASQVDGNLP
jgi:hypothetical protein